MSAATYWKSAAKDMRRLCHKAPDAETNSGKKEPPLTGKQFQKCCERGYESALLLGSFAQNCTVSSLKALYEESCGIGWFEDRPLCAPQFEDEVDEVEADARAPSPGAIFG
ncbi:unnamed protein product [Durusdinium trenchii]|uniref:Uncharacterized protein n=1 Tax=Durusdinium trenchii TaxID=1381693 RepID=A0ABP0Q639_9DINO